MSRKKIPLTCLSITALFMLVLLFSSCKDNPVVPKKQNNPIIDSVDLYDWKVDTLLNYLVYDFYVADSNNVFLQGSTGFIYYDGKTNTPIYFNDPNFVANCVSGFNKNSVFFGGSYYDHIIDSSRAELSIWNGAAFTNYILPKDSIVQWDAINSGGILVLSPDEAWISHPGFYVYHFQSGQFTRYRLDSLTAGGWFFKSPDGTIYLFTSRMYLRNPIDKYKDRTNYLFNGKWADSAYTYSYNYTHKFEGSGFRLLSLDTSSPYTAMGGKAWPCGSDFIRDGTSSLFYLSSDSWEKLIDTYYPTLAAGGNSKNDLFIWAPPRGYIWDGIKLSIEKNFAKLSSKFIGGGVLRAASFDLFKVSGRIYINTYDNLIINATFFLTGIPKSKMKAEERR